MNHRHPSVPGASGSWSHLVALNRRAQAGPDAGTLALARRIFSSVVLLGLGTLVGAIVLVAVFASGALPWAVGGLLALATAGVVALGVHAGGHGWLVPLPVLVLAGAWALTAAAGDWAAAAGWALASLTVLAALLGAALVVPAIAYRHHPGPGAGAEGLVGATGVALGPLSPVGVVNVKNETWSAQSLSGPLPAGAPVHVVKVEGLRLLVWSEAGTVLGPEALGEATKEKEER